MTNLGKIAILLLLCATTAAGFLWLPPATGPFLHPQMARIVVFHVPCAIVTDLASVMAGWYALAFLRRRRMLDDIKCSVSLGLALLFSALTTVTGAIFAKAQWGGYWNWDPKQTLILMLLLIYVAYFALRAALDEPRKRATLSSAYALFAVVSVPFLTYILPNSTPSLHPSGTLQGGLSADYSLVLWAGALGLCLVYVWAFRIHVAAGALEMGLARRDLLATSKRPIPDSFLADPSLLGKGEELAPSLTGEGLGRGFWGPGSQ